jgi:VanZ family protein
MKRLPMLTFKISTRLLNIICLIYLLTVFTLCVIPDVPTPKVDRGGEILRLDYLIHFVLFLVGGFLFFHWKQATKIKIRFFVLVFLGWLYAGLCEAVQLYVPGRTYNPIDLFYNILGLSVGFLFAFFILKIKKKQ